MTKKQFAALFVCSLVGWTVLQSILNLLPVYTVRLGADPALAGNFLALVFGALTAGALFTGWFSTRFQGRKFLLVVAGVLNIPITWLMGQATQIWQLALLAAAAYFLISVGFNSINILAGLFAGASERGKVFGLLAINSSLGALIGGAASGPIIDRWGYASLFWLASLCWVLQPLIALTLQDKGARELSQETTAAQAARAMPEKAFSLFLLANLIAFGASFMAILGRPLIMDRLQFDATAISGVVAVGGAVSLPLPFLLGWLSDRVNRYGLMVICFAIGAIGLVMLAESLTLWHFGASSVLLTGVGISLGIGPALVTDLVPPKDLGMALSWYNFAPSMGGILGFSLAGYAFTGFGADVTFLGGALLTLLAMGLMLRVQRARTTAPGL